MVLFLLSNFAFMQRYCFETSAMSHLSFFQWNGPNRLCYAKMVYSLFQKWHSFRPKSLVHVCVHTCVHGVCVFTHLCTSTCVYVHVCMGTCLYVCMHDKLHCVVEKMDSGGSLPGYKSHPCYFLVMYTWPSVFNLASVFSSYIVAVRFK